MRFGISINAGGQVSTYSLRASIGERIDMVKAARDGGFELASAGQHYLAHAYVLPQPIPLIARLAAEAPGMDFQIGILLAPFYQPVQLAEEMATLQAITGGHFRVALGLGYIDKEFESFGLHRSQRLGRTLELIRIVKPLLAGETVTYNGKYYRVNDIRLSPGAIEADPPGLLLGSGHINGIKRAGRMADGLYLTGYEPVDEISSFIDAYHESLAQAGRTSRMGFAIRREILFGESRKEALERGRPGWIKQLKGLYDRGLEQVRLPEVVRDLEAGSDSPDMPFILGTPEEMAEQLVSYAKIGVDMMVIRFQFEGVDSAGALRMIERFGADVIPRVQKALA
jgi:alkanesulfonate monooxygenase SsuD/methylene tetrahydromethanopterin reductase-like flavin-dependent oxidoreductase (luciferase family)